MADYPCLVDYVLKKILEAKFCYEKLQETGLEGPELEGYQVERKGNTYHWGLFGFGASRVDLLTPTAYTSSMIGLQERRT